MIHKRVHRFFLAAGTGVDDSNKPALENDARISNSSNNTRECQHKDWIGDMPGACPRLASGHHYENPKLDARLEDTKCTINFLDLLPPVRAKSTIAPETSEHLHRLLSFREFIKFLGLWAITMCFPGTYRSSFFNVK